MSRQSQRGLAHLAHLYEKRLAPGWTALSSLDEERHSHLRWTAPYFQGNLVEAFGWLIEGVFCGYFPRSDAELVWARNREALHQRLFQNLKTEPSPATGAVGEQVRRLLTRAEAFPVPDQMPPGKERDLEQSIFGHSLLLSSRLATDRLARRCICSLNFLSRERWAVLIDDVPSADMVAEIFLSPAPATQISTALVLAGFIRVLEHMAASQAFFAYVKQRYADTRGDFLALQSRVGILQGWMLNFEEPQVSGRYDDLVQLFDLLVRQETDAKVPWVRYSTMSETIERYANGLRQTWGVDHPFHAYAFFED
jgi:hypothetical protein